MRREHTRKFAVLGIILISAIMLTGCGAKLAGDNGANTSSKTSQTSTKKPAKSASEKSEISEATKVTIAKYEGILQAAQTLSDGKKFADSDGQLNTLSVTELAKPDFKALKTAVEKLRQVNAAGIEEATKAKAKKKAKKAAQKAVAKKSQATATQSTTGSNNSFNSRHLFEWYATSYSFLDGGYPRPQYTLTINSSGYVSQDDGEYTGWADIREEHHTGIEAYYDTDDFTVTTYDTDVVITIDWDTQPTQTLYGYMEGGKVFLSDNKPSPYGSDAVNEVWVG